MLRLSPTRVPSRQRLEETLSTEPLSPVCILDFACAKAVALSPCSWPRRHQGVSSCVLSPCGSGRGPLGQSSQMGRLQADGSHTGRLMTD